MTEFRFKRAVIAIIGLGVVFAWNVLTSDGHPVQQTLIGVGIAIVWIAMERAGERREAKGKPPLELASLPEVWAMRITVALASLAGLAIVAFAIGAILHG